MSMSDLKAKFRDCAASGVSPLNESQRNTAIETMLAIETVKDLGKFLDFARA